jgi:hypothetical protein
MPPMVLYRILGVMLYDDDSRGSPMIASSEQDRSKGMTSFSSEEASAMVELKVGNGRSSCRSWGAGRLFFEVELQSSSFNNWQLR